MADGFRPPQTNAGDGLVHLTNKWRVTQTDEGVQVSEEADLQTVRLPLCRFAALPYPRAKTGSFASLQNVLLVNFVENEIKTCVLR